MDSSNHTVGRSRGIAEEPSRRKPTATLSGAISVTPGVSSKRSNQSHLLGDSVGIPPRRIDVNYPEVLNRYWYHNNAFLTLYWLSMSSLFPDGEAFFVDSVKAFRQDVSDPRLRAQIAGFIGQEMMHSKQHDQLNRINDERGLPLEGIIRSNKYILDKFRKWMSQRIKLSTTVALEHFTAIMAEHFLRSNKQKSQWQFTDPEIEKLWHWHALEETEHKSVAFDLWRHISKDDWDEGYITRIATMFFATLLFNITVTSCHVRLLWAERRSLSARDIIRGLPFFFSLKTGLFPKTIKPYLDFYRPGFHPTDHPTDDLIEYWRGKLGFNNENMTEASKTH